ncbi:MAG: DUF4118 domain-containing protein [Acidimicrobiales bacterium]
MKIDRSSRTLIGVGVGGLGSLFVAAGLVGIRGAIANVNVALILVLVVLAAANFGGRTAGAMSGLVAATSFDFFHTRPYGLLKVTRVDDLITTLLLLVAGLVMGEMVERSARFKDRLRDDQRQLRRLHRVAGLVASGDQDERDLVLGVTAELLDTLQLEDCNFERPPFVLEFPRLEPDGVIAGSHRHFGSAGVELPAGGADLRVIGPKGTIGRFVVVPTPDVTISNERLLVAVALSHSLGLALAPC